MSTVFSKGELTEHAAAVTADLIKQKNVYRTLIDEVEAGILNQAMQHFNGNQSKAAMVLGMNRATLRSKLKRHGFI